MSKAPPRNGMPFHDLTLHYQPQVLADGSRIVGAEALLRVLKPEPHFMTADDVLSLISSPSDAEALDWWVLRTAFRDALRWPGLTIATNVTAWRFREPDFAPRVIALAEEIGLPPTRVELEIIEGAYIDEFEIALANITSLRARGFRIAIDDFGTGYSSLTYLLRLPVDKLKIDKSFVAVVQSMPAAAIVHAIVALARALGLKITAEGVETEEQQRFLRIAGCHMLQGWLFSPAVDADTLTRMVESGAPPRSVEP